MDQITTSTVDMTPTWSEILDLYTPILLDNDNYEVKKKLLDQLRVMAIGADRWQLIAHLAPQKASGMLASIVNFERNLREIPQRQSLSCFYADVREAFQALHGWSDIK